MECLNCGKRLSLLRKLSDGQFCTQEHRDAYHSDLQQLAVKRLLEARWPDKKRLLAVAEPPPATVTEHELLLEPPAPQLSGNESFVFLNVAPKPRQFEEYSLYFEDIIPTTFALILPEPLRLKKRSARADDLIPIAFSNAPGKLPQPANLELTAQQTVPILCRPESQLTIDRRNTPLHYGPCRNILDLPGSLLMAARTAEAVLEQCDVKAEPVAPIALYTTCGRREPAMVGLEFNTSCDLSFHKVVSAGIAGGTPVEVQLSAAAPLMPRLRGRTEWSPEFLEIPGILPMAHPEPVSRLARLPKTDPLEVWSEEQVQPVSLMAGTAFLKLQFPKNELIEACANSGIRMPIQADATAVAVLGPCDLKSAPKVPVTLCHTFTITLPEIIRQAAKACVQPGSLVGGTSFLTPNALSTLSPLVSHDKHGPLFDETFGPQRNLLQGALKTTFSPRGAAKLRELASYESSEIMDGGKPIGCAREEFHAWLNVPVFAAGQPSKPGRCGNLAGITGLDRVLPNPKEASFARSNDVQPSFGSLTPLLCNSRLTTLKPPLLTRTGRLIDEREEQIRNELSGKFKMRGFQFWREAPAKLKWVALGLPVIVAILYQVTLPTRNSVEAKTRITQQIAQTGVPLSLPIGEAAVRPPVNNRRKTRLASAGKKPAARQPASNEEHPDNSESKPNLLEPVRKFFDQRIQNLKLNLADRAKVDLTDDFRSGLTAWNGLGDWARSWTYDRIGLLRPGQLALYQPSMALSDYTLEFSATAELGSIAWVFRARDLNNYYGMRLHTMKSSAGTQAWLERWIVSGGRENSRKSIPLRMPVREGNVSRVRVAVEGSSFTTSVNGQIADTWTDSRIDSGGVGFFNEKGGDARIHKVSVSHQNDTVGKLCAMLAPHDLILKKQGIEGGHSDERR